MTIADLLEGGRAQHLQPHNAEAFLIHRAVPVARYAFAREWVDGDGGGCYYAEVRQANGQIAWVSPVWVEG